MTDVPSEKACTKCGETKPLDQFHRRKDSPGGRRAYCKECRNAQTAAWREANPNRRADYMAAWRKANPNYKAEWAAANQEAVWLGVYRHRAKGYGFEPVVEDFTKTDVIELYGDQCWHCKDAPFEELDHHPTPVAAEGPHTIENVKPSCARCNRAGISAARAIRKELSAATT